jgi:hypothetical protein
MNSSEHGKVTGLVSGINNGYNKLAYTGFQDKKVIGFEMLSYSVVFHSGSFWLYGGSK